ncbi:MAG TPA: ABC transporter permease [Acidobacteriaceae bacterium]|nr:ABC transporter permease [Acidobacteriaceae bacterium]
MSTLLQDVRYALRQLRKSPGFTLVAVLTLAFGIGANTAIYSIIHGALRLPYPNSQRMVAIQNVYPQGKYFASSFPDFEQWRDQSKTLSPIVALTTRRMTWTGYGSPETLRLNLVSDGYFKLYSMQPVVGRTFISAEHQKGGAPVCVLTEKFWREKLGSDPSIIGKPLNLDGQAYTVIGVAPEPADDVQPANAWLPLEPRAPYLERGTNYLFDVGLLRPGVTLSQASAEMRGIQAQINKQFPDHEHGIDLQLTSQAIFGDLNKLMLMLQAAVGFILLIACVNLANMLLARAAVRAREFAVRRALGASPARMIRQTLTESLLLSFAGAACGIAIAQGLVHIPISAWPKNLTPPASVHLDGTILAFTALLAIGTGLLFGIIPALRTLREDGKAALQQGRTVTESREQNRTRSALVIAEISLSMLLVAGALNMAFYFVRVLRTNPGMNPDHTLTLAVSLSPAQYSKPEQQRRFFNTLLDKLAVLPGVTRSGATGDTPFTANGSNGDFTYDGQPKGTEDKNPFADFHFVSPGYFRAIGTPLLQGRGFGHDDSPIAPKVAIINRSMAQKLWPGQNPIGKHVHCCVKDAHFTIIGVAGDVHFAGSAAPANYTIYLSADQMPQSALTFILRSKSDPMLLVGPARQAVASIDPGQAVSNFTSLEALAQDSIAPQRTSTLVTAILGLLALFLASIGVYGVMAYSVSRREREFGIRMALGANRSAIGKLLLEGTLRLTVAGLCIGAALAYLMRVWIDSLLGANGTNPLALIAAAALLCAVAALATLVPARHAMYVEPIRALRTE